MEYDTFRDPADPLTASAQVLFGAIASLVTGLADAPRGIALDLVSAARAIGHPREHFDQHAACRAAISSPDHSSREESVESVEGQFENYEEDDTVPDEESTQEGITDENDETHVNGTAQTSCMERKRSLQLENAKPMSSSLPPSKPHKASILYEAAFHGSIMSKKFLRLIMGLPTDVSLSMAKGFHNAPKLYNDPMVKDVPQVISVRGGFRAAGKVSTSQITTSMGPSILTCAQELRDGFYFGITGLVTQPHYGLKHKGGKGLLKGVGKGVGGVFLKPTAGTSNVPAISLFVYKLIFIRAMGSRRVSIERDSQRT